MLIKLENINKSYYRGELKTPALRGISFNIEEGEFASIKGPSGSGKSTLMHLIGFLDRPTSGEYFFEDENIKEFDDERLAKIRNEKVGFVFQTFNLLPRISLLENILLPTIYTESVNKNEATDKALELLDQLGLSRRKDYKANQISGGEQQRTAIARALINSPRLLLADEPTGNIDSEAGSEVMETFKQLNDEGNTIVVVTHEDNIAAYGKRTIKLKDGELEFDSSDAQ